MGPPPAFLPPVAEIAHLHGHAVLHDLKAVLFVEGGVFPLLRQDLQVEVVPVLLPHPLHQAVTTVEEYSSSLSVTASTASVMLDISRRSSL